MKREEVRDAVASAIRSMKLGASSTDMADDFMRILRKRGVECRPIPANSEERRAAKADEHERWATVYEGQAAEFEADGNVQAAESRRQMAREGRERAAIIRGEGPKRA